MANHLLSRDEIVKDASLILSGKAEYLKNELNINFTKLIEGRNSLSRIDDIVAADTRAKVYAFEDEAKKSEQVELKIFHHFSYGVYAREMHVPAGIILTGHVHKYANLNILSQGIMDVLIGDEIKRIEAPFTVVSPSGTKRIMRAITDSIWTTIHGTDEVDLDKIEEHFIAKTENEYLEFINQQLKLPLG